MKLGVLTVKLPKQYYQLKYNVSVLERFLRISFGEDYSVSTWLAYMGFDSKQIEFLISNRIRELVSSFALALKDHMLGIYDGKRRYLIINRRFGLDGNPPRTLQAIGEELGLTRERIRQIETKSLKRWKGISRSYSFRAVCRNQFLSLIPQAIESDFTMTKPPPQ
jgi:hypothetical protein